LLQVGEQEAAVEEVTGAHRKRNGGHVVEIKGDPVCVRLLSKGDKVWGGIEPHDVVASEYLGYETSGKAWATPQVHGQGELRAIHLSQKSPGGVSEDLSENLEPLGSYVGMAKQIRH